MNTQNIGDESADRETGQGMDFEYCPACAGELDTGYECLACGRDWRPWAMALAGVTETDSEQ